MNYWSPLAQRPMTLGLGYRRGKLAETYYAPRAVVVHTTGRGPLVRATSAKDSAWRAKFDIAYGDALRCAIVLYTRIMADSGHYVIGQDGSIVQLVPESHIARHVGSRGSRPYFTNEVGWHEMRGMEWWTTRWPGLKSPRDLAGGHLWDPMPVSPSLLQQARDFFPLGSCNANSVGIEVVPPLAGSQAPWSAEAWHALASLVRDICGRQGIPVKRDRIITHSDAHPLSRTEGGKPWDPAPSQWAWERFEKAIGDLQPQATA